MDEVCQVPKMKIIPSMFEPKNIKKNSFNLTEAIIDFHDTNLHSRTALEEACIFIDEGCIPTSLRIYGGGYHATEEMYGRNFSRRYMTERDFEIDVSTYRTLPIDDVVFCGSIDYTTFCDGASPENPRILIIYLRIGRLIEFRFEGDYCDSLRFSRDSNEQWRYVVYRSADEYINTNVDGADKYMHDRGTWKDRLFGWMGVDIAKKTGVCDYMLPTLAQICDDVYVYDGRLPELTTDNDAYMMNKNMIKYPIPSPLLSTYRHRSRGINKILDYRLVPVVSVIVSYMDIEDMCIFLMAMPSYDRELVRPQMREIMDRENIFFIHFGSIGTTLVPRPPGFIRSYRICDQFIVLCENKTLVMSAYSDDIRCLGTIDIDPFAKNKASYSPTEANEWRRIVDKYDKSTPITRHGDLYDIYPAQWDNERGMYTNNFPEGVFAVNEGWIEIMSKDYVWVYN